MRKITSLILVAILALAVLFSGCGAEKTAEEHIATVFDNTATAIEAVFDNELVKQYDNGVEYSISVGDINYILNLAGVDTSEIPPLSDISLNVKGNMDRVFESLNVKIGETLCDITFGIDAKTLDFVISSAQIADVYGAKYSDILALAAETSGMTVNMDVEKLLTYDNKFVASLFVKYLDRFEALLLENTTVTKSETEDGKQDIVTVTVTPEGLSTILTTLYNDYKNDAEIKEMLTAMYGEEMAAEFYTALDEAGSELGSVAEEDFDVTVNITVDKKTSEISVIDADITADGESVTMLWNATETGGKFELNAPDGTNISAAVENTEAKYLITLDTVADGTAFGIDFTAENGKAVLSVETPDATVNVNGSYEITDTSFNYTLESVGMGGFNIDLVPAGVVIDCKTGVEVPELATVTKSALEVTEEDLQGILMEFIMNSGLMAYMY